jgi:uncharacterized cupredoxin-like copper-binding protein
MKARRCTSSSSSLRGSESEIEDIAPGETDELEWTFTEPGRYQFACHVPGHFEAGMVVEVEVTE